MKEDNEEKLQKEILDRQDAYFARANNPHKFRAVDPSIYAMTRDQERCAYCGENIGHRSHYNSMGHFYHQGGYMKKTEFTGEI